MKTIISCFALTFLVISFSYSQSPDIGVVSYTFRKDFSKDVSGTLDKIKGMGITNIEFSSLFGKTAGELKALLDERGLHCTILGVSYGDLLNKSENVIKDAKILGAEFVRVGSIPHPAGDLTEEIVKKAVVDFNIFGKHLKENGLKFCFHNHASEFLPAKGPTDGTLYDYLVQKTNPEYVSFEIDVFWVYFSGQDPIALLKKYPDRFKLMHLKDLRKGISRGSSVKSTSVENNVAVGSGQIDFEALMKVAKKTNITHFYIEDESSSVDQQVPLSLTYLKRLKN